VPNAHQSAVYIGGSSIVPTSETIFWGLWVALVACFLGAAFAYYPFTAEDAYISLRYAKSLTEGLGPIYNPGEPVNAMTSPLHVGVSAVILSLSDAPIWWNKSLGLLCIGISGWAVSPVFAGARSLQLMVVALAVLPAPVLMWSVGGLETPFLAMVVSLSVWMMWNFLQTLSLRWYLGLCLLGGAGFLLRFDASLFFAGIIIAASVLTGFRKAHILCWAAGAIIPLAWLIYSQIFFGDILPTSFHEKTPSLDSLLPNVQYLLLYLASTGGLVAGLIVALGGKSEANLPRPYAQMMRILAIGLGLFALYAITMMTKHMMFQLRALAPYFGVIAALVGGIALSRNAPVLRLWIATGAVIALSILSCWQIVTHSVNGFARGQEYSRLSLPQYARFMEVLDQSASQTATHWDAQNKGRTLRLFTPTAGIMPYRLGHPYVYTPLISYRHTRPSVVPYVNLLPEADYVHVLVPPQDAAAYEVGVLSGYEKITSIPLQFDGEATVSAVYFTNSPREMSLPARVNEP
jgi:arabinofuranosyltransferase